MESIGYEKTLSTNLTVGVDENDGKVRPVTDTANPSNLAHHRRMVR